MTLVLSRGRRDWYSALWFEFEMLAAEPDPCGWRREARSGAESMEGSSTIWFLKDLHLQNSNLLVGEDSCWRKRGMRLSLRGKRSRLGVTDG